MQSPTTRETTGFRRIADRIGLAVMAILAIAGIFWPRITLSSECFIAASALLYTNSIWKVSGLVVIGGWLAVAAGFVLAAIQPIH